MPTKSRPSKAKEKQKPDDGQGSKGNFGSDGDWGKTKEKSAPNSSPVPKKNADE